MSNAIPLTLYNWYLSPKFWMMKCITLGKVCSCHWMSLTWIQEFLGGVKCIGLKSGTHHVCTLLASPIMNSWYAFKLQSFNCGDGASFSSSSSLLLSIRGFPAASNSLFCPWAWMLLIPSMPCCGALLMTSLNKFDFTITWRKDAPAKLPQWAIPLVALLISQVSIT